MSNTKDLKKDIKKVENMENKNVVKVWATGYTFWNGQLCLGWFDEGDRCQKGI